MKTLKTFLFGLFLSLMVVNVFSQSTTFPLTEPLDKWTTINATNFFTANGNYGYHLKPAVCGKTASDIKSRTPRCVETTNYHIDGSIKSEYLTVFDFTGCDTTIEMSSAYDMLPCDLASLNCFKQNCNDNDICVSINSGMSEFQINPSYSTIEFIDINTGVTKYSTTCQTYGSQRFKKVNNQWVACGVKTQPLKYVNTDYYRRMFTDRAIRNTVDVYAFDENGDEYLYGSVDKFDITSYYTTKGINNEDLIFDQFQYKTFTYNDDYSQFPNGNKVYSGKVESNFELVAVGGAEFQVTTGNVFRYSINWYDANDVIYRKYEKTCNGYDVNSNTYLYHYKIYELNTISNQLEVVREYRSRPTPIVQNNSTTDLTDYTTPQYSEGLQGVCFTNNNNFLTYKVKNHTNNTDGMYGNYLESYDAYLSFTHVNLGAFNIKITTNKYNYFSVPTVVTNGGGTGGNTGGGTGGDTGGNTGGDTGGNTGGDTGGAGGTTAVTNTTSNIISIYPTIVIDNMTIGGIDGDVTVEVYDLNGKMVKNEITNSNVAMSDLIRGHYMVRVLKDRQLILTEKVIKN